MLFLLYILFNNFMKFFFFLDMEDKAAESCEVLL